MTDELLDVVDEKGNVVGQAYRDECHNNPKLIHRVVHCWIFNSQGQVLWQQRSFKKKLSPGMWDMSCGGHVPAGKTPDETIVDELEEELGLRDVEMKLVEKYLAGNDKQTELIYLYYTVVDKSEEEFKLQEIEVEKVKWFDIHEALSVVYEEKVKSTHWIMSQMPRILQYVFKVYHKRDS